jgi:hypothetical protein
VDCNSIVLLKVGCIHSLTRTQQLWIAFPKSSFDIASHWDVATLIEKKQVCQEWKEVCSDAIGAKRTETTQKVFSSNQELRLTLVKYCRYNAKTLASTPNGVPERTQRRLPVPSTYGYPIHKYNSLLEAARKLENFLYPT